MKEEEELQKAASHRRVYLNYGPGGDSWAAKERCVTERCVSERERERSWRRRWGRPRARRKEREKEKGRDAGCAPCGGPKSEARSPKGAGALYVEERQVEFSEFRDARGDDAFVGVSSTKVSKRLSIGAAATSCGACARRGNASQVKVLQRAAFALRWTAIRIFWQPRCNRGRLDHCPGSLSNRVQVQFNSCSFF